MKVKEFWSNYISFLDRDIVYLKHRELAPNIPERGDLVFEIPQDAASYSLIGAEEGTDEIYKVILK